MANHGPMTRRCLADQQTSDVSADERLPRRSRGRSPALLSLQRLAGNRAVGTLLSGTVMQRLALPNVPGMALGSARITESTGGARAGAVTAIDEVVPPGSPRRGFPGFGDWRQAHALAVLQSGNLVALVRDQKGRYHALRTGWSIGPDIYAIQLHAAGRRGHFEVIRWVNDRVSSGTPSESWESRVRAAEQLRRQRSQAGVNAYRGLLAEALRLPADQVHEAGLGRAGDEGHTVAFDANVTQDARAWAGTQPDGAGLANAAITFGPLAFVSSTTERQYQVYPPESVQAVLFHEATHAEQRDRLTDWYTRWARAGRPGTFREWVLHAPMPTVTRQEVLSQLDNRGSPGPIGEFEAHISSFIASYQRLSAASDEVALVELVSMRDYFDMVPELPEELRMRLAAFVRALSDTQRTVLRQRAERQATGNSERPAVHAFWLWLISVCSAG
jgi:hypothetical protein